MNFTVYFQISWLDSLNQHTHVTCQVSHFRPPSNPSDCHLWTNTLISIMKDRPVISLNQLFLSVVER